MAERGLQTVRVNQLFIHMLGSAFLFKGSRFFVNQMMII